MLDGVIVFALDGLAVLPCCVFCFGLLLLFVRGVVADFLADVIDGALVFALEAALALALALAFFVLLLPLAVMDTPPHLIALFFFFFFCDVGRLFLNCFLLPGFLPSLNSPPPTAGALFTFLDFFGFGEITFVCLLLLLSSVSALTIFVFTGKTFAILFLFWPPGVSPTTVFHLKFFPTSLRISDFTGDLFVARVAFF